MFYNLELNSKSGLVSKEILISNGELIPSRLNLKDSVITEPEEFGFDLLFTFYMNYT